MEHQTSRTNQTDEPRFPEYLSSLQALSQHIRGQLEDLTTTEKGDRFAHFVQRLVPQTEAGSNFVLPELREKKSGDEGVDLVAQDGDDRSVLYIQSRLWVDRTETIDSVLSKFQAYLAEHHSKLVGRQYGLDFDDQPPHFMLVTLSSLKGILKRYEEREWSSKDFYQRLIAEHHLHFVDGDQILLTLKTIYRKLGEIPANLTLNLEMPALQKGNVYFGIISSKALRVLYNQYGDALFFENIRDFLGPAKGSEAVDRITPNNEIIKTITTFPDKMLERNNGIVFGADEVNWGKSQNQLILTKGSVVNGCQTTMCLVAYAQDPCYVSVKVVQTSDSWDITKAANYQNSVAYIDLDLARSLRPQLAKRAALTAGVQVDNGERSAFQVIDEIYDRRVAYKETRLLYIGIFSRTPNNVFEAYHAELRQDIIDRFHQKDPYGDEIFETLFTLQNVSRIGLNKAEKTFIHTSYAKLFRRLYGDDSQSYTSFISILALCGSIDINIADRSSEQSTEYDRMNNFLVKTRSLLETQKERFLIYYTHAVKIWMQEMMSAQAEDAEILRDMYVRTRRANFINLFRKLCMEADLDSRLREEA